ncbi:MAG: hypothetical protein ACPGXX_12320, partial [Planctomycetaceae bacterium]
MNSKYTTLLLGLQLLFFAVGCEEQQAPGGLPAGLVEQAIYERQTPPPQASPTRSTEGPCLSSRSSASSATWASRSL